MRDLLPMLTSLAWPFAIAIAWIAGEFGQRWTGLPRISFYGLAGFALAHSQLGILPVLAGTGAVPVLAGSITTTASRPAASGWRGRLRIRRPTRRCRCARIFWRHWRRWRRMQ